MTVKLLNSGEAVGEEGTEILWLLAEDSEQCTATATHRCIACSQLVQLFLDLANPRVLWEDALFKVVP